MGHKQTLIRKGYRFYLNKCTKYFIDLTAYIDYIISKMNIYITNVVAIL